MFTCAYMSRVNRCPYFPGRTISPKCSTAELVIGVRAVMCRLSTARGEAAARGWQLMRRRHIGNRTLIRKQKRPSACVRGPFLFRMSCTARRFARDIDGFLTGRIRESRSSPVGIDLDARVELGRLDLQQHAGWTADLGRPLCERRHALAGEFGREPRGGVELLVLGEREVADVPRARPGNTASTSLVRASVVS